MTTKKKPDRRREHEPVGIVISGGPVHETPPVFAAYEWGPAPEPRRTAREPRVA